MNKINAAYGIEERDVKKYKTETNEISRARKEAAVNENLVVDGESGRKEEKREAKDPIYGQPG